MFQCFIKKCVQITPEASLFHNSGGSRKSEIRDVGRFQGKFTLKNHLQIKGGHCNTGRSDRLLDMRKSFCSQNTVVFHLPHKSVLVLIQC